MPRPGPRPYECVRRAWHSDRHLPIRGSLIQEIFRLANEVHKTATKKNKEWQEKLPIVVLRAEKIMYYKANSEAEYVELKTLRDRVNDAISTIIRDDESSENGKLLQPCVEAALHLGCTPRKSSRSQRNNASRHYLTPGTREDPSVPPLNVDNKNQANHTTYCPFMLQQSKFMTPTNINSRPFCLTSDRPIIQHDNCISKQFFCSQKSSRPSGGNLQCLNIKPCPSLNSYCVYPLYFGDQLQSESSNLHFGTPTSLKSRSIEAGKAAIEPNLSSIKEPMVDSQTVPGSSTEKPHKGGCDLSLRLGPLIIPSISNESSLSQEVENICSGSSQEGRKLSSLSPEIKKDFSFFPEADAEEQLHSSSTKRSKESETKVGNRARKRKAIISPSLEDGHSGWQLKVPSN